MRHKTGSISQRERCVWTVGSRLQYINGRRAPESEGLEGPPRRLRGKEVFGKTGADCSSFKSSGRHRTEVHDGSHCFSAVKMCLGREEPTARGRTRGAGLFDAVLSHAVGD